MLNSGTSDTHPGDLLAWYANGTLEGEERVSVEAHLRDCERCRGEVAFLERLREQVKASTPAHLPGELGLKRLQRQLQEETRAKISAPAWWRPAMAAAVLIVIVQSGLLLQTWQPEPTIEPLSGQTMQGVIVQVEFAPDASIERINELLRDEGATIVDGPGAIGIYRVRLDVDVDDSSRIEALVARLEARSDVVRDINRE